MKKFTLKINSEGENRKVNLDDELSIGRTDSANIALPDNGLSRVNTTFFRDGDEVFVVDENSTNGTFVNGKPVFSTPHKLLDGDEITLGNNTVILFEAADKKEVIAESKPQAEPKHHSTAKTSKKSTKPKEQIEEKKLPLIPIVAALSTVLIVFVAAIAIILVRASSGNSNSAAKPQQQIPTNIPIPVRVIDPLGNQDPEDIDDLIALLDQDIADDVQDASTFDEVKSEPGEAPKPDENGLLLNVPISVWQEQKNIAMSARDAPTGTDPPGQIVPPEIAGGGGVPKQKAKLAEMKQTGYMQPMDFAELAQKRMNGELLELPMASQTFFLDVGGNASDAEFSGFDFGRFKNTLNDCYFPITPGTPKYQTLEKLAGNFAGQKYDLNNPRDRKQIRIRLLRMFHPKALKLLQELAGAYYNEFKKPLRVTSLTRSMDYQISLNKNNLNSFKVRGPDSLPPHTSGCAFDLSRKQMTAKEQNFVMAKLAEMEKRGVLDGLREGGANACFHVFIYNDGIKPKGF